MPIDDLKPLYAEGENPVVRAFVSDGDGTELDRGMAERIGIQYIIDLPGHSHAGLGRYMRDSGWLAKLLR